MEPSRSSNGEWEELWKKSGLIREDGDTVSLKQTIGEFALVSKINVVNIERSKKWYEEKVGFIPDPRFDIPNFWAQLRIPEIPRSYLGLIQSQQVGTGNEVLILVVDDIARAIDGLIKNGVEVSGIEHAAEGVQLAWFKDPDNNALGLRQNHPKAPRVASSAVFP